MLPVTAKVLERTVAPPTFKVVPTDTALPIVVAAETAAGRNTIAMAKSISAAMALEIASLTPDESELSPAGSLAIIKYAIFILLFI